jgi:hypothetical protein
LYAGGLLEDTQWMWVRVPPPPHPPPRVLAEFVAGVSRVWPSWKKFWKVSALVQIFIFFGRVRTWRPKKMNT